MSISSFWKPIIASLIATPAAFIGALISAGAGHGNYVLATILFPFTMLSTVVFGSITWPFVLLAIVQFLLYGVFLGIANKTNRIIAASVVIMAVHAAAVVLFFLLTNDDFR